MLKSIIFSVATIAAFTNAQDNLGSSVAVPSPDQSSADVAADGSGLPNYPDGVDPAYSDYGAEGYMPADYSSVDIAASIQPYGAPGPAMASDSVPSDQQAGYDPMATSPAMGDGSSVVQTVTSCETTATDGNDMGSPTAPPAMVSDDGPSISQVDVSGASSIRGSIYCGALVAAAVGALCL